MTAAPKHPDHCFGTRILRAALLRDRMDLSGGVKTLISKPVHARSRRPFIRAATLLIAALAPAAAWAVCTCGFQDGLFTLAPIMIEGNMADWAPVLADPDNNVCDGPTNGLTDRDAPVQSTGRDLTHFAYTWDLGRHQHLSVYRAFRLGQQYPTVRLLCGHE